MNAQTNLDAVGREFDKWLDWNGTADESSSPLATSAGEGDARNSSHRSTYVVSPSSTANSDSPSMVNSTTHTAPSTTGPLTPSHSSGSPEVNSASVFRLSGDTLREDDSIYRQAHLKRKLSSEAPDRQIRPAPAKPGASKRPHNVIEKRYRANLNEKIAELRDSVPVLRAVQKARSREEGDASSGEDNIESLGSGGKLNKASILTKAVEYIKHLEFRNKRLEDENRALKERLHILDKVIAQGGSDAQRATAFTSENVIENPASEKSKSRSAAASPSSSTSPSSDQQQPAQGLVSLPDSWKRLRQTQQQEHYGHVYDNPGERSRIGGKWPTRLMLGSLTGLMIMEGFAEHDQGSDSREKGLFGIPLELLDGWTFLWSPRVYMKIFADYCRAGGIIPLVKGFMALSIFAFFIFAYLFNSKPHPERDQEKDILEEPKTTSPASPIAVRRRAWSTSMQALRLPHHSFFPEWLALTSEWIKYSIQYCIGHQAYASLTGRSREDELARIKFWDTALDAQLAGGDTEISRSRLVLTIYGSGTLPQSPLRLMQKALHCRVLLWNVGLPGTAAARLAKYMATVFANRQWRYARQLHERLTPRDTDRLPGYLNYLLQMDCEDVFNDMVMQRATNLMYDRPTSEYAEDMLMDVVVEDHAIRSPLDAVAAWRSTSALRDALDAALNSPDSPDILREHIQGALEIAPPGSAAETRALAVHAVLSPGRRGVFYERAVEAITSVLSQDTPVPYFIDSSTPFSARPEIAACLHGAKVMLTLDQDRDLHRALSLLAQAPQIASPTVLSIAPLYFVLWRLWRASGSGVGPVECNKAASQVLAFLHGDAFKVGGPQRKIGSIMEFLRCTWELTSSSPSRRYSVVSNDTGYGSLSDEDQEQKTISASPPVQTTSVVTSVGKV